MSYYQIDIVISILRITFLAMVFFVLLPRIFSTRTAKVLHSEVMAEIIVSAACAILLGYTLEFLHFYDTLVILVAILIFISYGIVSRFGGKERLPVTFNTFFLRKMESKGTLLSFLRRDKPFGNQAKKYFSTEKIFFFVVFLVAAAIRLWPVYRHASPFAIETFQTIESVKKLELNHSALEIASVPLGMQFLIDYIYQLTRTDVGIIAHLFGIVSAFLLMFAIYSTIKLVTENGYAAIFGAAIFGIFTHILPISINQQIEAERISIATVIAVPTIFYGLRALIYKEKYIIVTFISGAISVLLISRFVTVMLLFAALTFFLVTLLWRRKFANYIRINYVVHLLLFFVPLGAMIALQSVYSRDYVFLEKARLFFYNEHFIRYSINHIRYNEFAFGLVTLASGIIVLLFGAMDKNPLTSIAKTFSGIFTFFLLMLWQNYWLGLKNILDWRQVGLFVAVLECINIGVIFNFVLMQQLPKLADKFHSARLMPKNPKFAVTVIALLSLWIVSRPGVAAFSNMPDPDGFTKGVYKIKKKLFPYQWTAVSHLGTKALVLNSGRFMDYAFFLQNFSPETIHQNGGDLITTRDVFIFTEKDSMNSHIDTALLPNVPNVMTKIMRWCRAYSNLYSDMSVFYEDDQVIVYRIHTNLTSQKKRDKILKTGTY